MANFRLLLKRVDTLLSSRDAIAKPERGVIRTWADLLAYQHSPEQRRNRFGPGPYTLAPCWERWATSYNHKPDKGDHHHGN